MIGAAFREQDKWWPRGVVRYLKDPVTGQSMQQTLMTFYNEPATWRCPNCGWNEVFSRFSRPLCRKCRHGMRVQENWK